jgi:PAS domain S-box-containing protein
MSKEFKLFEQKDDTWAAKLVKMMDLLVSNKSTSRMESVILIGVSYLQIIAAFYSEDVGLFTSNSPLPDNFMTNIKTIVRVKDLFKDNYSTYTTLMYCILVFYIFMTILFGYTLHKITKNSFYSLREMMINTIFKIFTYILLIPILDLSTSIFCFGDINPNFSDQSCSITNNPGLTVICLLVLFYTIAVSYSLAIFYHSNLLNSNCYFARITCNYEVLHTVNIIISSILLTLQSYLGTILFLIYSLIQSLLFVKIFFEKYPFYDRTTNFLIGMFHMIYAWTSIFGFLFSYISVKQKGIIYVIGTCITIYMFRNLKQRLEESLILEMPFHKISNKNHILFYFKYLLDIINTQNDVMEDKAEIIGILQLHMDECPLSECMVKKETADVYLPLTEEWSKPVRSKTNDKVYMLNFITFVINFFVVQNYLNPDLLMNISIYYLLVIGNHCNAMLFHNRVTEYKLSSQEKFAYERTRYILSKVLVEKLKPSNENTFNLEEINTTMYFKYEDLSQKFYEEITNDVNLNLEYWKIFKGYREEFKVLDFRKVFALTDRIRISKAKIQDLWSELFETYPGYNEIFDLYENYVTQVNDDDITLRELEAAKNKIVLNNEHIGIKLNFYNVLFSKDTGIIIASGDKGREGMIEKINENVTQFFNYPEEELKGSSVNNLLPKVFEKHHKNFMERYITIGEKRVADKTFRGYAKDKKNNLVVVTNRIKLFPLMTEQIYFCSMINKESMDDVVLLDNKFNIQGMSEKLMSIFKLNENIFQDCDIPFYLICAGFINHYKLFMMKDKNLDIEQVLKLEKEKEAKEKEKEQNYYFNYNKDKKNSGTEENYEISENAELEFEIRIPQVLRNFISSAKKDNFMDSATLQSANSEQMDVIDEYEGDENDNEEDSQNIDEDKTLMDDTDDFTSESRPIQKTSMKSNKESGEDREFQNKINYFRNFFEKRQYEFLEKELDRINYETRECDKFKFIITLNRYGFGDGQIAYVVRLIDNREDGDDVSDKVNLVRPNLDPGVPQDIFFTRDKYLYALKNHMEVDTEDIDNLKKICTEYYRLSKEDPEYATQFLYHREEILQSSRIFGIKRNDMIMDEQSSQASTNSYNDDLSKKARVEEIKYSMLKNVSNFYTLKIIKLVFYCIIIFTLVFSILYINILDSFLLDSTGINQLSTNMYINTFTLSNFISNLVSMRTLFEIVLFNEKLNFASFLNFKSGEDSSGMKKLDKYNNYFYFQGNSSQLFANKIKNQSWYIEYNLTKFVPDDAYALYWDLVPAGFNLNEGVDNLVINKSEDAFKIGYPIALEQNLVLAENLIKSNIFNLNYASNVSLIYHNLTKQEQILIRNNTLAPDLFPEEIQTRYRFYSNFGIDYAYDILIPHQLFFLTSMNQVFSNFNKRNIGSSVNAIIIYTVLILFSILIYVISLYLTNKNMEQSLFKVCRITAEHMEETIVRIEYFNEKILNKFRLKEKIGEFSDAEAVNKAKRRKKKKKAKKSGSLNSNEGDGENTENKDKKNDNKFMFSFEQQNKFKNLNILKWSYFIVLFIVAIACAILIPVYFKSDSMIINSNAFLDMKKFVFKDLISASINLVSIKCAVSRCNVRSKLTFNNTISSEDKQNIIEQIKFYPVLDDFYNNKYLLSICDTLYNVNISEYYNKASYENCMKDNFIQSANNTESLLKNVFDNIFAINKQIQIQLQKQMNNSLFDESLYKPYESRNFMELEYAYNNFILKLPSVLDSIFNLSLSNYLAEQRQLIFSMIVIFSIILLIFSLYIIFIFTGTLIHLLSISRCLVKVVPTGIINKTQELEEWIENKY